MSLRNSKNSRSSRDNLVQIEFIDDIVPVSKEPGTSSKFQSELLEIVAAYLTVESRIIKKGHGR